MKLILNEAQNEQLITQIKKDPELLVGKKVKVYYDVNRHMFSVTYSGIVVLKADYVRLENCTFLVGEKGRERVRAEGQKNVHPSAANQFLIPESQWFSPHYNEIGNALKDVFENYKNYTEGAKRQAYRSKTEFSWEKMKNKVDSLLTQYIPEFPKAIELKLPQLKKIELPKLKKIEING